MPKQGKRKRATKRKRIELGVPEQEENKARRRFQKLASLCNLHGDAKSRLVEAQMKQWRNTSQAGRFLKS